MEKPVTSGDDIIVIPSDTIYLAAVDDFISNKLARAGISPSTIADLSISASEIVNNAIIHGNAKDAKKTVKVKVEFKQDEVYIFIKDQGKGFNPDIIPNPTDKENLLKKVGRGIFIARSLVDSVDFNITDEGTEVVLKKNIKEA
jgi:serine/threonine-protein kinase RsbW